MGAIETIMLVVFVVLAALLIGYATGRRYGLVQGRRLGRAQAPLFLRRQVLATGHCPICDATYDEGGRRQPSHSGLNLE